VALNTMKQTNKQKTNKQQQTKQIKINKETNTMYLYSVILQFKS
jgi:hypothetical protein